ncbi:MAG: ROK family protein [Rhizobiaceae bacterium]
MSALSLPSGVAVDLGGTKISAARVTDGIVGDVIKTETDADASINVQIEAICGLVSQIGFTPGAQKIGVAVAGRVSSDGQWFAVNSDILSQIDKIPLRDLLVQQFGQDVKIQNDATAAAQGEMICGAGRGMDSFAYITVSTGVGGGIILNRKPVTSGSGLAGHVGFVTSRHLGGTCGSGRRNTVESIASGRALVARAEALGHRGMTGKDVFAAHLSGANWASELVTSSAAAIAELGGNLKAALDIEAVIIGGGVGLAEGYAELVEDQLSAEPALFRPQVRRAALAENSALIGILAD